MRSVFMKKFHEAMRRDKRLFFLAADQGFGLIEPLFAEFPDRTLNVGIAEQNMIGISAGLCNAGFRPLCYAISNFLVHRCMEQVRNDVCIHDYPVILLGTSTGFDHGTLWATHHVVDDIGCMKPLPNLQIYSPSSIESMAVIFDEVMASAHPTYIRLSKASFSGGKAVSSANRFVVENPKAEILLVSHGKMVANAFEAAKISGKCSLYAVDKIKPVDSGLAKVIAGYDRIVVIEDNFSSGLYNSIAQFVADHEIQNKKLRFIGPKEEFDPRIGDQKCLEERYGLTPRQIADSIGK